MRKQILQLVFCAFCLPIMFIGCSEDDDEAKPSTNNNTNNQNEEDQMIFSVDGVERDYSDIVVYALLGNDVSIEGLEETSYPREELVISFPDTTSTGTYSLSGNNSIEATFSKVDSTVFGAVYGEVYLAIDGTLNLTQNDIPNYEAAGTFSFTAVNRDDSQDTLLISGGSFQRVEN